MAERLARLACSLATWMSVLFWRASSMARFRVRETAVGVVDWGWGACCAWTGIVRGRSRATWTPKQRRIDFAPALGLFFMHASFCGFDFKSGGLSKGTQDRRTPHYS